MMTENKKPSVKSAKAMARAVSAFLTRAGFKKKGRFITDEGFSVDACGCDVNVFYSARSRASDDVAFAMEERDAILAALRERGYEIQDNYRIKCESR